MARITRDEVLHVARLARLELSDDDVAKFQEQLSDILEAVSKVSELDLSDVPPTAHPLEIANAWAEGARPSRPMVLPWISRPSIAGAWRSPFKALPMPRR